MFQFREKRVIVRIFRNEILKIPKVVPKFSVDYSKVRHNNVNYHTVFVKFGISLRKIPTMTRFSLN